MRVREMLINNSPYRNPHLPYCSPDGCILIRRRSHHAHPRCHGTVDYRLGYGSIKEGITVDIVYGTVIIDSVTVVWSLYMGIYDTLSGRHTIVHLTLPWNK